MGETLKRFLQVSLVVSILAVPATATADKGGNGGGPPKPPQQPTATVLTVSAPVQRIGFAPPEENICFGNPPGRICAPVPQVITWMSARLTTASGSPVTSRPVVLRGSAGPAGLECTQTTNASGYMLCRVFGYWTSVYGTFAGDASYAPSSGTYQGPL